MNTSTHECRMQEAVATFLQVLRERRSRRFGLGMKMATGPMAYQSRHPGIPLSEEEEAFPDGRDEGEPLPRHGTHLVDAGPAI